jgi:hypothetical protein
MADFDAMLAREALMMGRKCTYVNGWSFSFTEDEIEHEVAVIVYRVSRPEGEYVTPTQNHRVTVYVDGRPMSSAII